MQEMPGISLSGRDEIGRTDSASVSIYFRQINALDSVATIVVDWTDGAQTRVALPASASFGSGANPFVQEFASHLYRAWGQKKPRVTVITRSGGRYVKEHPIYVDQ